jgi:hypothetical protein
MVQEDAMTYQMDPDQRRAEDIALAGGWIVAAVVLAITIIAIVYYQHSHAAAVLGL